jgi:hypothetical protein
MTAASSVGSEKTNILIVERLRRGSDRVEDRLRGVVRLDDQPARHESSDIDVVFEAYRMSSGLYRVSSVDAAYIV